MPLGGIVGVLLQGSLLWCGKLCRCRLEHLASRGHCLRPAVGTGYTAVCAAATRCCCNHLLHTRARHHLKKGGGEYELAFNILQMMVRTCMCYNNHLFHTHLHVSYSWNVYGGSSCRRGGSRHRSRRLIHPCDGAAIGDLIEKKNNTP